MTREQALASAEAQYQQHRAAYLAALLPAQVERAKRNADRPQPTGRRNTIERERGDVIYRSQCPYVGVSRLIRGAK